MATAATNTTVVAAIPEQNNATAEESAASVAETVFASTQNTVADSTYASQPDKVVFTTETEEHPATTKPSSQKENSGEQPASTAKPAAATNKDDSEDRKTSLRRKAPSWVAEYSNHPQYGAVVARQDDESDTDYHWRMWHTAPPWADELPRNFETESETQWIQRCWLLTSPEERAAHEASLPTTAR